jgi:CheY-specific phosphatase CheX
MKEMNDEIKDAVGEFANMITGQVTTKFTELEKSLKFETPEAIMDNGHKTTHKEDRPR